MGGDNAPAAVIEGIIQALEEYKDIEMYITGPEKEINEELSKYNYEKDMLLKLYQLMNTLLWQ